MARPITLFTGQWADLPFEEVARLAGEWGYDGLEIACWGDHLDVSRWDDAEYVQSRLDILERNGLKVYTVSNHLTGQAVCDDPIDERHRDILSDRVWGDGDPEGVRQRAAEDMKNTARFAPALGRPAPRMDVRLDRARRGAVGAAVPRAQRDRIRGTDERGVGGRRHGSTDRRSRGTRVRAEARRDHPARRGLRRRVLDQVAVHPGSELGTRSTLGRKQIAR